MAADFDKFFGPVLMVTYACLSNTLLLTGMSSYCDNYLTERTDYFAVLVSVRSSVNPQELNLMTP
jgi:hypothetical protein